MRSFYLFLILLIGAFTIILDFRSVKHSSFFVSDMLYSLPFYALCIVTIICFVKNVRTYRETKKNMSFISFALAFSLLSIVIGHKWLYNYYNNYPAYFIATNYDLGTDGGFNLEFKENSRLKGMKIDRFSSTIYWGSYRRNGDTLLLEIPLDFKLGRQAVLQDSILQFVDDTVKFEIFKY